MNDKTDTASEGLIDHGTEDAAKNATALAAIAASLQEHGLAPDMDYDIAILTIGVIGALVDNIAKIGEIGVKLAEVGLVTDTGDGLAALDFMVTKYRELEAERDTLRNALSEQERKAADTALKASKQAKAVPVNKHNKQRYIKVMALKKGDKPLPVVDLLELINAAETVEVAFSDGEKELSGVPPVLISGDAWKQQMNGLKLMVPSMTIHGPGRTDAPLKLAGYGLLLDGDLVAYQARGDALTLSPGGQYDLKDDVIFS